MSTHIEVENAVREVYFRLTPNVKKMRMDHFLMRVESILGHNLDYSLLKIALTDLKIKMIQTRPSGIIRK